MDRIGIAVREDRTGSERENETHANPVQSNKNSRAVHNKSLNKVRAIKKKQHQNCRCTLHDLGVLGFLEMSF